jgi:ADP-heptose:LPS heptosyltransferase
LSSSKELVASQKWIGIAPFAAHSPKQYPLNLMKQVLAKLDEKEVQVLLFGGGSNEKKCLESLAKDFKKCYSIAEMFSFPEELQLISNLEVMLSMDSGNGHLAAMFGVDVITLWGATHPYAGFAPYGQTEDQQLLPDLKKYPLLPTSVYGNKKVKAYKNVMQDITPDEVFQKLKPYLD